MPRKKQASAVAQEIIGETGATQEPAFSLQPDTSKTGGKSRFSISLKEDGSVDLDSMRDETKRRFREFMDDPRLREAMNASKNLPELVTEQDIYMLYDLIGAIEGYAFALGAKIDYDIARKNAIWKPEEKEMVLVPTRNVILKHPEFFAGGLKWKDEVILTILLITISRAKLDAAKKEQKARRENREEEISSSAPTMPDATTDNLRVS